MKARKIGKKVLQYVNIFLKSALYQKKYFTNEKLGGNLASSTKKTFF